MSILLIGTVAMTGCKKKSEPAAPLKTSDVSAPTVQTTCPVMKGPVNKDIFTEYQGKKVYFCCNDCKAEFSKDPAKYISKLPQFQN